MPVSTPPSKTRRRKRHAKAKGHLPQSKNSPTSQKFWVRFAFIWLVLLVGQFGLIGRLVWLQVYDSGNLKTKAQQQQRVPLSPQIGLRPILDRNGDVLAKDVSSFRLFAHPFLFKEDFQQIASKLDPLLKRSQSELLQLFASAESGVPIEREIDEETAAAIRNLRLDGLELNLEWQRIYPQNDLMADVVGYVNAEHQGQTGIEYSQQPFLAVPPPNHSVSGDAEGLVLPNKFPLKPLGNDHLSLRLTLDTRIQWAARKALNEKMKEFKAKRGAVMVMDVHSGELLGLVSNPVFNPERYYEVDPTQFKNWAIADLYEPGSTFKPINIAIALDLGKIKPDSTVYDEGNISVGGWPIRNNDGVGRGALSITQVLEYSSNVGMVHIMEKLKRQDYYDFLKKLGIGEITGTDLPFETPGQVKDKQQFVDYVIEAATTSFGQGFSVTPLQMVQLHATLANGGKLVTPHVVQGLYDADHHQVVKPNLAEPRQVFSPETADNVRKMMGSVVTNGTGKVAQIPGYRLGGKTGTAQKAANGGYSFDRITSFVSIFPLEKPKYVVFAVVDEPKGGNAYGSTVAAPVVKAVLENLIAIEGIPPTHPEEIKAEKLKQLKATSNP